MCLAGDGQQVILPDLNAGCSMADMAEISQVEDCWDALERLGLAGETIPLTYMNSTAAIKAFCGERGGLVCTSSNARGAFEWAFARGKRILFLPDQHLGRNTGYGMGIPLDEMAVWDPWAVQLGTNVGGQTKENLAGARVILWKGHCAVHQRFLPGHVDQVRAKYPGIQVIVHPECRWEVCQKADALGSTERLIALVEQAPAGSMFAIGHRDPPGEPAGTPFCPGRQEDHHTRRHGLPVHHDVPHQSAAPGVGPGKSGGGPRGEPNQGAGRREALGAVALDRMLEVGKSREQGTGNREQGTGNREKGKQGTGEQGTGNREQGTGREQPMMAAQMHCEVNVQDLHIATRYGWDSHSWRIIR